jgi:hypothetical protein
MRITIDKRLAQSCFWGLTRCVGAGQREVEVDVSRVEVRDGDRFVLATDGLWGVVPEREIQRLVLALPPQDAAVELVRQANRRGGPDNITVLIIHVRRHRPSSSDNRAGSDDGNHPDGDDASASGGSHELELPAEELHPPALLRQPDRGLIAPRWPWFLLVVGGLLLTAGIARVIWGVDWFGWSS